MSKYTTKYNEADIKYVRLLRDIVEVRDDISSYLNKDLISKMEIICYGASYLNDTIKEVLEYNSKNGNKNKIVKVELVICSAQPSCIAFGSFHKDASDLTNVRNFLKAKPNITVYPSKVIPTIRACAIYNDIQPIYCYYQSYYFYPQVFFRTNPNIDPKHLLHYDKGAAPIIVAKENDEALEYLYDSFKIEFERLKERSDKT